MLWHYRALWLFGAVLALVGANRIFPGPWLNQENNDQWTKIKVSDTVTIQVPGVNRTVDLTAPEGFRLITPDSVSWREFRDLVEQLNLEESINLWPIMIEFAVILAISLILGLVARYVMETAVIRMVNETEETGKRLSLWEGLRRGFSSRAGRLFLRALGVLAFVAFTGLFGLVITPILLATGSQEAIVITAGVSTLGLLVLGAYLWLAASALLSLVLQPIRRACVLENKGLWASIRQRATLTKHHLKEIGSIWLVWMSIRLVWVPLSVLILIGLVPLLLLTTLAGVALGGVPAALIAGISSLYTGGATPWIMGALAGLPIFFLVTITPLLFMGGLVEIYKSTIWTLAYHDLQASEGTIQAAAPRSPLVPAHGMAD